ncbi:hypothetical protein FRB99_003951 [Tulasnella sp. 403]|nr:hypothetical protein FRB99_003951 [Tulasnella sp. 403]
MAPLSTAILTTPVQELIRTHGAKVYEGNADPEWTYGSVSFGGYLLSTLLHATLQHQSGSPHPDPIYLNSQFIRAVVPGPFRILVKTVKTGNQFDNLDVGFYQKDMLKITCQITYGNLSSSGADPGPTLPAAYSPECPMHTHPAASAVSKPHWAQNFCTRYEWSEDPFFYQEMARSVASKGRVEGGMKWGAWIHLKEEQEITPAHVPIFADLTRMPWDVLPAEFGQKGRWWLPTLTFSLEFKCKLPGLESFAPTTLGAFGWKRHLQNGRWNDSFELWTAPCGIGEKQKVDEKWREKMVCVAVGSQVALAVAPERNSRHSKKAEEWKSKL